MAQRRMFSKEIVRSDAFLDMPTSSQLLYFQLGMEADDDGFVDNVKTVSRIASTAEDDLKILLSKRFLLPFKSGIVVIKHWKINNYIQMDRYKETKYLEEKNGLTTKENRAYTECIQPVSTLDAQTRLDKTRLDKVREEGETVVSQGSLNELIELFKELNPMYTDFFKNKTERKALLDVVDKLGFEKTKSLLEHLPEIVSKKFAPKITKPTELKRDMGKLILFFKQESQLSTKGRGLEI